MRSAQLHRGRFSEVRYARPKASSCRLLAASMKQMRVLMGFLVVIGLITSACDSFVPDISLQNRTGEPVIVYWVDDEGQEIEAVRVETAYGTVYPSTCSGGPLVVRTLDGELVATSPRLCTPTEWEITWGSEGPPTTGTLPIDS